MSGSSLNVLEATAADLRRLLELGQVTSVQIVEEYLAQIEKHEHALNALASLIPRAKALGIATALDEERRQGSVRGPLHGIPVVLKNCFITSSDLGMTTSAGAVAFADAEASKNSAVAQKLIDAGMIILAKANMTEFAGMKTIKMMPGWSAHGGQTISPYVGAIKEGERLLGHSAPGGSSTGSAVSVAAGFSPIAMGAETIGSIVTPAVRAALYAIKPTVGVQDTSGLYKLSEFYDSPGPMAKCASDVLDMTELLLGRTLRSPSTGTWEGLRIAYLDPGEWSLAEEMCEQFEGTAEQMRDDYEAYVLKVKEKGAIVKYPVELAPTTSLDIEGKPATIRIAYWEFKHITIPEFIGGFDKCSVGSLKDIVRFNEQHKDVAMPEPFPEQDQLTEASGYDDKPEDIEKLKQTLRALGKSSLDAVFDREDVNIIIAPGDSPLCIHAAAAGYPLAAVPLSRLRYNGRPFGLCLVAREHEEGILLRFMAAFESLLPPRPTPLL
ncbi:amidase signature enzyme [Nemania sp. NC0429]|nr:amidase signature enzyme [Nemania sp. NC0429]